MARPYASTDADTEAGHSAGANAVVFMGFVLVGCAYIVTAKLGGIGQLYVTFVPVATMLVYALLISFSRSLRLRDDQSGDNLYYMGFLFTLSSLGHAVSREFRAPLRPLRIEPHEFAMLRAIAPAEGLSQQALAERLHIPPSRMVAFVDGLAIPSYF